MTVLTIRTDKPEAELGLYDVKDQGIKKLVEEKWEAHRQLAETIHKQIAKILDESSISLQQLNGLVIYRGPGSFTGLRIGLSVANAIAYANNVPVVATSGSNWQQQGIEALLAGKNERVALPEYGAPARTTRAKK